MAFLHIISYVVFLAAFAFVTLSLASGLLYLSELIEEHSRLAKVIGQRGIHIIIVLHIILYFSDSLPFRYILFSVICHVVYLQNFSNTWPLISLTSPSFIGSCILVILDHFLWFFYFSRITQEARQRTYRGDRTMRDAPGFADVATFFVICVWLAPLFLFLSLSANDNALPTSGTYHDGATPTSSSFSTSQSHGSLFKTIYDLLPFDALRRVRPKGHRSNTEGLIAPPSPNPIQSSFPLTEAPTHISDSYGQGVPRTPGSIGRPTTPRSVVDFEVSSPTFRVGTPPRSPSRVQRRVTTDSRDSSM